MPIHSVFDIETGDFSFVDVPGLSERINEAVQLAFSQHNDSDNAVDRNRLLFQLRERVLKDIRKLVEEASSDDSGCLRVVRAAIRDDRGAIWSIAPPGRHHQIIALMRAAGYEGPVGGDHQGFVLSDGRFARRKPSKRVAEKAGQIKGGKTTSHVLTSEDLW